MRQIKYEATLASVQRTIDYPSENTIAASGSNFSEINASISVTITYADANGNIIYTITKTHGGKFPIAPAWKQTY